MLAHCNLKQNMCLHSKQSSLFSFYALPSGGKSKDMVVHWIISLLLYNKVDEFSNIFSFVCQIGFNLIESQERKLSCHGQSGNPSLLHIGKINWNLSGSHGLVVMWEDSCIEGCEFKSQSRKLDWHVSHVFVVKKCNNICLKRRK